MSTKMKGLLKGLRYISQIFENEKEQEMEIGFPTDVKHVAHIGWDGPSVTSPSWMNEFRTTPGFSSAPLGVPGDMNGDGSVRSVASEGSSLRGNQTPTFPSSPARDLPELPKSSRRHSTGTSTDSPTKSKSDKSSRGSRRASKGSPARDPSDPVRKLQDSSLGAGSESSPRKSKLPDIPKKSRRKKSKDSSVGGGSSRSSSRSKAQGQAEAQPPAYDAPFSDPGSENVSTFKNLDLHRASDLGSSREGGDKEI
ncbi:CRIB domain-containing protein RIC6-like [Rhodamnia argentea]|uniref:CRIB domain-containing protein RIC6-like n=1 Tax=Rhodamnia argentea TaxID=178133 RepID=A0A8B8Q5W0_9MYRT|nr:CRIB domain-containing protein RIC6-like [Rhodamnia argentea]